MSANFVGGCEEGLLHITYLLTVGVLKRRSRTVNGAGATYSRLEGKERRCDVRRDDQGTGRGRGQQSESGEQAPPTLQVQTEDQNTGAGAGEKQEQEHRDFRTLRQGSEVQEQIR